MSAETVKSVSMTRYVVAGAAAKAGLVVLAGIAAHVWQIETMPNLSTPSTIASVALAISWYIRSENRPLTGGQLFSFATGTAFADLCLTAMLFTVPVWWTGLPLSIANMDVILFDGSGSFLREDVQTAMAVAMFFGLMIVFAVALFFAWIMTRRLPRI